MKKIIIALAVVAAAFGIEASALDLKGILGSLGNAAPAVSGVVEGLLTQSDISVPQMAGNWTATGSAIAFQSENFLAKAGGSAAASTIESKLDPYYKQYGLTGSTLDIDSDGKFTLKVKGISLKGSIAKRSDGNFDFSFTPFGSFKVGTIKAYVEKTPSGLNVMFDASKLKSLISTIAGLTGNSLAKTAGSLLESYDGMMVGFAYTGKSTYNPVSEGGSSGSGFLNGLLQNVTGGNSGNSNSAPASPQQGNETVPDNSGKTNEEIINNASDVFNKLFNK